jgi:hypothetical protein
VLLRCLRVVDVDSLGMAALYDCTDDYHCDCCSSPIAGVDGVSVSCGWMEVWSMSSSPERERAE